MSGPLLGMLQGATSSRAPQPAPGGRQFTADVPPGVTLAEAAAGTAQPVPIRWSNAPARPVERYAPRVSRIFMTSFASVYPHYVTKVEKKGRTRTELHQVIEWLTGFDEAVLNGHL